MARIKIRTAHKTPEGYYRLGTARQFGTPQEAERFAKWHQNATGQPVVLVYTAAVHRDSRGNPWAVYAKASAPGTRFRRNRGRRNPDSAYVKALYAAEAKAKRPLPSADWERRAQETAARMTKRYSSRSKAAEMAFEHSMDYPLIEEEWLFWRRVSNLIRRL